MAEVTTIESYRDDKEFRNTAKVYERHASEALQELKVASNELDGMSAYKIWQTVDNVLQMARMAAKAGHSKA